VIATRYRDLLRGAWLAVFTRAEERGEIAPATAESCAEIVLMWMLGMAVAARGGADRSERTAQFAALRAVLASWRVQTAP
jgi:hypothetical protein